ncbi:hypothetical protein CRI93_04335 [Longimonas halophila]|uniref:Uncharacterized protein n=1 Tax=Longimonas halophila TaxID=1469170 RepID=A0A2H3NR37_9BACT|nr:hypothetical protein [Longimonas halophila]PEN08349.1 hypothetical protein CRI93_04335 [Longimonas halophila]
MAHTSPSSASATQNALNALDTRDVTLPQRLWSWLAKQASEQKCSVDEVLATLIDVHRHPEQAVTQDKRSSAVPDSAAANRTKRDTSTTAAETKDADTDTAADRLRRMSNRLSAIRGDATDDTEDDTDDTAPDTESLMNEAMSALQQSANVEEEASDASESTSGSMFDVVRDEDA